MATQQRTVWSLRLSTLSLVLIPVAVGVNYVGKFFAETLKLPLWLDSIGTILAGMLSGPWVGAISGAVNNIIFGLTVSPISFWYLVTSIVIGLLVGYLAVTGWIKNIGRAIALGFLVGVAAAIVSTPINILLWEGFTGNSWGDSLFGTLTGSGWGLWPASFMNSFVVDVPDKLASVIVSFLVYKALPQRLTGLFGGHDEIERI